MQLLGECSKKYIPTIGHATVVLDARRIAVIGGVAQGGLTINSIFVLDIAEGETIQFSLVISFSYKTSFFLKKKHSKKIPT